MTAVPRYWSLPFIDAYVERLNEDEDFQRQTRSFSDTIVLQCLDTPDGKDVRAAYTIDAGYVTADVLEEDSPSTAVRTGDFDVNGALARATAPYEVWSQLDRGELNVMGAMASPDYRIEGPTLKIMMNLGVINALSGVAARMPKTY